VGGKRAQDALAQQLAEERYEGARKAEAQALLKLRDRRAPALITRFLGMETSLPDGVRMLIELRSLSPASARGALLTEAAVRSGTWTCSADACRPGADAEIVLPARGRQQGAMRVTWLVRTQTSDAALSVDGERLALQLGEQQVSLTRGRAAEAARFKLSTDGDVELLAVAVVPSVPEIPPPPPEAWDGGTPGTAAATPTTAGP
jgi:hypothetical protein